MKRNRLASSLCSLLGLLAAAGSASAGISITAGSIGGSGSAIGDGITPDAFACAGVPLGTSCNGTFGLNAPTCDVQSNNVASQSAQVPLSATGGGAGTSGGLGDDPAAITTARADAQGFITADGTAAGFGELTINMCGSTTTTPSGSLSTLAEYSANINTPGIKFSIALPGTDPVPFTEEYTGVFAPLAGTTAFLPDLSAPNPGTITQQNGQMFLSAGAYELVKSFSRNAGNRPGDDATFSGGYRLTVGTNGTVSGACCFDGDCELVSGPGDCEGGFYLGDGTTCDQCNGQAECCYPWDNGRDDLRGGQTSQIGVDQDWQAFGRVAFDDFWLCEGQVSIIHRVSGTMNTNSVVPKVIVVILPDCDGRPVLTEPLAVAGLSGTRFDVDQEDVPFVLGRVEILDNSRAGPDGFRSIEARAYFDLEKKLALKGGVYWVTFIGVSGTLDPLDEFFWATSGNGVVKGKPGAFFNDGEWLDSDLLCCGCTDYNFCLDGETCKILLDNGGPILSAGGQLLFPGVASLQNGGNTATKSRAADKFVVPPCVRFDPCYIEGWVWTNCERVALQFFRDSCHCPLDQDSGSPLRTADCVMGTGIRLPDPSGIEVELKKVQFFLTEPEAAAIGPGTSNGFNLWLSLVGLGDNRQNARAYFAFGDRCDRPCESFGPGCFRPAPFDQTTWRPNGIANTSFPGFDHAFLIAMREPRIVRPPVVTECPADINRSGDVTVQDIFSFLEAFFTGCP
jgi:hypothetical protein